MRLLHLSLKSFKNLRDFTIDFDSESSVAVLVGRNSAGKSNVLEALTMIFRDLDLGEESSLDYSISYLCRKQLIEIVGTQGERAVRAKIDGVDVATSRVAGSTGREARPDFVFGYYSGPTNRLEDHFVTHQERFYRDLVHGVEHPLRPLFYARAVHSNFVLLAFFLDEDPAARQFLSDHLSIDGLDSVLFEMQKPSWKSNAGDPRFWNARGTVRVLLDRLYEVSLAPMRLDAVVKIGLRRATRNEHLYLFVPDLETMREIRQLYDSDQEFFKALESTYISELIYDVRIRVALRRAEGTLTFRELSEGEQQLLLVLGLMRFTREEESLFLLDEPDTHLNPAWSARYKRFLLSFGGLGSNSHALMATHDPLVISALTRQEVRILERAENGIVRALVPLEDPRGMGVGALLTSDVYGLESQLDPDLYDDITRKRFLSAKDELTREESVELANLAKSLSELGFLIEDRDPDFEQYIRARYRAPEDLPTGDIRTQEEVESDRRMAAMLMREIDDNNIEGSSGEANGDGD